MATTKVYHATSLAVQNFTYGVDDFDTWVKLFEEAVALAHGVDAGEEMNKLCLRWLPLKLDETSQAHHRDCKKTTWAELKVQISKKLVDPQEKYDLYANRNPIRWDSKETFYQLATRIKQRINRHDTGRDKQREYFAAFRGALPDCYRQAIDLNLGEDEWDLEKAMMIASRVKLANSESKPANTSDMNVGFTGASMADDRIKTLELSMQEMKVGFKNMLRKIDDVAHDHKDRRDSWSSDRHLPSRDRDWRDSYDSRRDDGRRSRDRSRDNYRSYGDSHRSPSRSCQDDYDHRDRDRRSSDRGRDQHSYDQDYDDERRWNDRDQSSSSGRQHRNSSSEDEDEDKHRRDNADYRHERDHYGNQDRYRGSRDKKRASHPSSK